MSTLEAVGAYVGVVFALEVVCEFVRGRAWERKRKEAIKRLSRGAPR